MRSKVVVTLFVLFTLTNIAAWGIDLTGTWEGKQVCQYFDGRKSIQTNTDVLQVSQNGDDFYFFSDLVQEIFHGRIIESAQHPDHFAQAVFVECETTESSAYQELGRATKLQTKSKGGGLFKATSNFFQLPDSEVRLLLGTCIWTYQRVNTTDPNIGSCIASKAPVPGAKKQRR
jgi:hypothetical protein